MKWNRMIFDMGMCVEQPPKNLENPKIAARDFFYYRAVMKFLTRQEQLFLIIVLGLLLTGWLVKWYRTAHLPMTQNENAPPLAQNIKP